MHLRRSLALSSGALLLIASVSSCGFDPATNQINNVATGTESRDLSLDVLGAVIVSDQEGSGTFVATFVNNDTAEEASVEAIEPDAGAVGNDPDQVSSVASFPPITIEPNGLVNLADESQGGIEMEGEFAAGDVVAVTLRVSGGQAVSLDVPVVDNCGMYAGLDGPGGECEVPEPVGEH